jgi:hypothetical protein
MDSQRDDTKKSKNLRRAPRHIGETAMAGYNRVVDLLTKDILGSKNESVARRLPFTKEIVALFSSKSDKKTSDNQQKSPHRSKELKRMIRRSNDVLASATTVFPFDLFPDSIVVDRTKVTITKRNFFWSEQVMSIRIEDVLNVSVASGPFFGALTIASRVMSTEDHFTTRFFWRKDAAHLKHIIQGYVIARHNRIDTKHLSRDNLIKTLEELGQDKRI